MVMLGDVELILQNNAKWIEGNHLHDAWAEVFYTKFGEARNFLQVATISFLDSLHQKSFICWQSPYFGVLLALQNKLSVYAYQLVNK
jgi:hypothetical protein